MAPSASSPRIGRGSLDPALTLPNPSARSDDSQTARTSPGAGDGSGAGGRRRELPEAAARAEALDAKWQSAIDAATD